MNKRRIIHAFDAGRPAALAAAGLARGFHAWRGKSGRRYLTTVHDARCAPAYGSGAIVVLARPEADGTRVAVWAGRSPGSEQALARLARMKGACEVHLHLTATDEAARAAVEADLVSPMDVCQPALS
ncbi:hypothetical protein [Phreatobacter sp.]|uniref:hypothetical protein n=1 Tax=Phreatobacter sp. TaxID=1966341 RepID=UPI003F6EE74A